MPTYKEYIRSDAWRRKRVEVIRRAGGVCERCGDWPIANVHHLSYRRLGNELPADLLGVCRQCHHTLHGEENRGS